MLGPLLSSLPGVLLTAGLCLGFAYWLVTGVIGLISMRTMRVLAQQKPPDPPRWPKLSVIIPACNEAATIEAAVRSRLDQDYPDFEVCVIDDRSTDGTGAIVDRLAEADPRVKAVHVTELPEGWLGKIHALHRGVSMASGEWLLLTDADVHFAPGTLRRAVACAEAWGFDFVVVLPVLWQRGLLVDAALSHFLQSTVWALLSSKIEERGSKASVGSGVFNMVRRSAYERSPGLPWLKMEVADDIAFGQMMKRSGARCCLMNGRGTVGLSYYDTLREMIRGFEKNSLAVVGYSYVGLFVGMTVRLFLELSPWIALLPVGARWLQVAGAIMVVFAVGCAGLTNRAAGRGVFPSLLTPIGATLLVVTMLRAGIVTWRRGGIVWRGTLYPLEALKAGARLLPPW